MYQRVIDRLGQLSDPVTAITNADHRELIDLYISVKDVLPHSATAICKMYNIKSGNFSKWISQGKRSPIADRTVRRILISIYTEGKMPPCDITADVKFKLDMYQRATTIDDVLERISVEHPQHVIIIDRDNTDKYPKCDDSIIISVVKKLSAVNIPADHLVIFSQTQLKDSADITCCVLATKISVLFPRVKLIICTRDHFAMDLSRLINCEQFN